MSICMHTHTSATMENLAAAQNLLGLFRTRNNKVIVVLCSTVSPRAFIVSTPCHVGCDVQYVTAVVCTCIEERVFP